MFIRLFVCFFVLAWFLPGCSSTPQKGPEYNAHDTKSYLVRGRNRTFAAYNGEHRLITHPIEDLLAEMKWRQTAKQLPPISDVYVVSHGWNFTAPVAVANYHNYMQMIDQLMRELDTKNKKVEDVYSTRSSFRFFKITGISWSSSFPSHF